MRPLLTSFLSPLTLLPRRTAASFRLTNPAVFITIAHPFGINYGENSTSEFTFPPMSLNESLSPRVASIGHQVVTTLAASVNQNSRTRKILPCPPSKLSRRWGSSPTPPAREGTRGYMNGDRGHDCERWPGVVLTKHGTRTAYNENRPDKRKGTAHLAVPNPIAMQLGYLLALRLSA